MALVLGVLGGSGTCNWFLQPVQDFDVFWISQTVLWIAEPEQSLKVTFHLLS